jgi:hypothetical protein
MCACSISDSVIGRHMMTGMGLLTLWTFSLVTMCNLALVWITLHLQQQMHACAGFSPKQVPTDLAAYSLRSSITSRLALNFIRKKCTSIFSMHIKFIKVLLFHNTKIKLNNI